MCTRDTWSWDLEVWDINRSRICDQLRYVFVCISYRHQAIKHTEIFRPSIVYDMNHLGSIIIAGFSDIEQWFGVLWRSCEENEEVRKKIRVKIGCGVPNCVVIALATYHRKQKDSIAIDVKFSATTSTCSLIRLLPTLMRRNLLGNSIHDREVFSFLPP